MSYNWRYITNDQLNSSDADAIAHEIDAHNQSLIDMHSQRVKEILSLIKTAFGENSKQYKYFVKNNYLTSIPYSAQSTLSNYRREKEELRVKEQKQQAIIEHAKHAVEAKHFLAKNNKPCQENLSDEDIICKANDLAASQAIAYATANNDEFYIDDNICECESWDGTSRRCSCGNRRIYWDTFGVSFTQSVEENAKYICPAAD